MNRNTERGGALTAPPIVQEVDDQTINRILGETGRRVLEKALAQAQKVVKREGWQVERIEVAYRQDYEDDTWEEIVIAPRLLEPANRGFEYLDRFVAGMAELESKLTETERRIFALELGLGLTTA